MVADAQKPENNHCLSFQDQINTVMGIQKESDKAGTAVK
jgi:hypothetical protein